MIRRAMIENFINRNRDEAVVLLEELGKIAAPSYHEDQRSEFCHDWFVREGVGEVWVDAAKNVACKFGCDGSDDISVFAAHMDVVFDDREELPMRREGNILYAPGIGDDTANLVNLMMGCRFLLENRRDLKRGVMIVANSCEEGLGNSNGIRGLFSNYGARIGRFVSFDGYQSQVTSIPVGSHRYRVQIKARGGHSYLEFGNSSAVVYAAELIGRLYSQELPDKGHATYNVGRIEGGSTVNSIPEFCEMLYEYRSSDEECLTFMRRQMNSIVSEFRAAGVDMNVQTIGIRPGMGDIDRVALQSWTNENIEAVRMWFDGEVDEGPYSTDSNIPLSRGVFANTIGTVRGGLAHTRGEWVDLDSISSGMGIVCSLIGRCLA